MIYARVIDWPIDWRWPVWKNEQKSKQLTSKADVHFVLGAKDLHVLRYVGRKITNGPRTKNVVLVLIEKEREKEKGIKNIYAIWRRLIRDWNDGV